MNPAFLLYSLLNASVFLSSGKVKATDSFVFQTIGGLADDSVTLIDQILRNNASNIPYNTLKYLAMSEMSVAIQRENGNMFWRTLVSHFSK